VDCGNRWKFRLCLDFSLNTLCNIYLNSLISSDCWKWFPAKAAITSASVSASAVRLRFFPPSPSQTLPGFKLQHQIDYVAITSGSCRCQMHIWLLLSPFPSPSSPTCYMLPKAFSVLFQELTEQVSYRFFNMTGLTSYFLNYRTTHEV